jgi:hypothetical protein
MVPPEGRVRGICRDTIYPNGNRGETEAKTQQQACNAAPERSEEPALFTLYRVRSHF